MKITHIILAMILTGCGDLNVADQGLNEQTEATPEEEGQVDQEVEPNLTESATATATATCTATATAGSTGGSGGQIQAPEWHYLPGLRTYDQAVAETPDGYRIPTRAELIQGVDSGDLKGYTESVWSSTRSGGRDDHAYTIRLKDGWQIDTWKEARHQTIYIK